jgi:hypothetical protein
MDYETYLESLNEVEEVINGMFSTAEREIEWVISDHDSTVAKSTRDAVYKGLNDALSAITIQKQICMENL